MTQEKWGQIKRKLQESIGVNNYKSWIEPIEFEKLDQGVAVFAVPTPYLGNYVSQNFSDLILYELNTIGAPVKRLSFQVAANRTDRPVADMPCSAETTPAAEKTAESMTTPAAAPLDSRFTFDTFVVGKPNALAHAAARRVSEGGPVTFNPLMLYGGVGLGKTHLMHAIAWELQERNPGLNVLFLSAEQFMYRFVQALREKKMMDFKQLFRAVDVLMVDDVQFIAGKDSTQEEFFHTFNALVDQNKQIIISADRAPGEIKGLEERIKSRLQCGLVADLHPTDYELRLGILQNKYQQQLAADPGLIISDGVLEYLARKIQTNVRILEGALTRLCAFASLVGRDITMELTQDCLADLLRQSDRKITVEEIQRKVADFYNIRFSDLVGPKRLRVYARPRQVAMYLCKKHTSRSLPDIGRRFGKRDHTTVMHGIKRIEDLMLDDSQIAEDVKILRRLIEE